MKKCTYCGSEYPDEVFVCPVDTHPLQAWNEQERQEVQVEAAKNRPWLNEVLLPAALWLVVNFTLVFWFGPVSWLVFNLLTGWWAAMDCSKLRSHGSRTLRIAFKPIVAFALCAFLMWGFGFIWYLVLRRTVKDAPVIPEEEG